MLASSGDPGALADALEPLLVSADRREELGNAGRESFLEDFTDAAMRRRFFTNLTVVAEARGAAANGRIPSR
jgi:hypothetical protein